MQSSKDPVIPRLTPDGDVREPRKVDHTERSRIDSDDDPELSGDRDGATYANTDEAAPDSDGTVQRGDGRDAPLI